MKHYHSKSYLKRIPVESLESIVDANADEYDDATQQAAVAELETRQYDEMIQIEQLNNN